MIQIKKSYSVSPPGRDTEILAEIAAKEVLVGGKKILELGTGTGYIVIGLARQKSDIEIWATDIDETALRLAAENAKNNGVRKIKFIKSDLFDSIQKTNRFDLIIFNPPFAPHRASRFYRLAKYLARTVKLFHFLAAGGIYAANRAFRMALIKKFLDKAPDYLLPGGRIIFVLVRDEFQEITSTLRNKFSFERAGGEDYSIIKAVPR